ncbi:RNA polymerase sigma factor [Pseudodesulfovibrio sp.]|uniref:RNA polymerase sigma factor n=1 Tax=unclassified Pseudodesulfovibrio TaxID=2661612 RepID=UPI003AFF9682
MKKNAGQALLGQAAFRRLYGEHAGQLCAYLTRCLRGDVAEAEGIVQEAFLKAWEKREALREESAFKSWLYTIALNVLRQRKRRLRPVLAETADAESGCPSPERQASDRQELARAMAALAALSEEQREAVLLVRMENMKFREAAEVLGVPENTVKTRVRRGLLAMAATLGTDIP